jgi:hypothetical protein
MMTHRLDVPFQVRDLAAFSLDNINMPFALFFDAATRFPKRVRNGRRHLPQSEKLLIAAEESVPKRTN